MDNIHALSEICYRHVGCMLVEHLDIFVQAPI